MREPEPANLPPAALQHSEGATAAAGGALPTGAPPARGPAVPPVFLFELHEDPIYGHPVWLESPHAVPCVRIDVRLKYTYKGEQTWDAARSPAETVRAFTDRVTRYIEGFGPYMGPRGREFRWYGMPAGLGGCRTEQENRAYPNAIALLNNPADRLRSGRRGPFAVAGIAANRAWSNEFCEHLAAEVRGRRLPDPIAFILSTENGVGDDFGGHEGDPDKGWVPEALADPRADDPEQTVDGTRTFRAYMDEARTLEGGPIPAFRNNVLGMPPGRSPKNAESSEAYRGAMRLLWDWSRYQGFGVHARAAFRRDQNKPEQTVRVGEYQAACDSRWAPVRMYPRTLLHQMNGIFHSDVQCPDWYGGIGFMYTQPELDRDDAGWNTEANWLREFPVNEADGKRRYQKLALEIAKAQADACARSAPHAPLAPYVYNGPNAPWEDMAEYLLFCRSRGAWAVNVYMPKSDRASHDYWQKVIERVCV